jgi:hypothetical protein
MRSGSIPAVLRRVRINLVLRLIAGVLRQVIGRVRIVPPRIHGVCIGIAVHAVAVAISVVVTSREQQPNCHHADRYAIFKLLHVNTI